MVKKLKLIGPFSQILTMGELPLFGPISDDKLEIIHNGGVLLADGRIIEIGASESLKRNHPEASHEEILEPMVLVPGLIDAHTHICYAGSRANDYALRIAGKSYLEIAKQGGGILSTVKATRKASQADLETDLLKRCKTLLKNGVTSCEVKSGYGLTIDDELKMLRAIKAAKDKTPLALMPTCLAAHTLPPEFKNHSDYLDTIITELLPKLIKENLSRRIDIFIEESAFSEKDARPYLKAATEMGFDITVHADQFTTSGSKLAAEFSALSADHLEASTETEIDLLAHNKVPGIVLPGASLGLGMPFPKTRQMLDKGMCIAIASDWNPGSAAMGDLLLQAAILSASEKLSTAETLAAITYRATHALKIDSKGRLDIGFVADMIAFPSHDYRDILYHQGMMKPKRVWINGEMVK